ncbi:MAG: alpha-N-arabinofuranosidase [Armatimonadota bacterium]|nr:alpha-N-arabinofuranosidase [Armatimonadota bacterium]
MKFDRDFRIGAVDDRLYGSFIEHLGRQVYGGVYEPGHPSADDMGFRTDVMDLVRKLGPTIIRYPGGNFVSAYNWEDGVGPVADRPKRLDVVWDVVETNEFGTNEFCEWTRRVGAQPMMAVNMGTRGLDAARSIVEYCNHPSGSYWSDLRISHGYKDPHNIKVWCLGNEMDGHHQMGHKPADQYGIVARESGKLMKMVDPSIELTISGSAYWGMPSFPDWNITILEQAYEQIDMISIHTYLQKPVEGTAEYMARPLLMDSFISTVVSICDVVKAKHRSRKPLYISLDEWNVWWREREPEKNVRSFHTTPQPYLEEVYSFEDAVVVGLMIITLLKHADRVKIACFSELVNTIACITTRTGGPVWPQATYYPLMLASKYGRGVALNTLIDSPVYESKDLGPVTLLDGIAILDDEHDALTIFAVNRSQEDDLALECDLRGVGDYKVDEQWLLAHEDWDASNTEARPDNVVPRRAAAASIDDGKLTAVLPKLSYSVLRMKKSRE